MTDRGKVIIGLEQHMKTACMSARGQLQTVFCPYFCDPNCITTLCRDTLELLKEQEIKPYGGFIEFPDAADEITGYKAIVERMMDIGILKVEKQEAPMLTRYNWAIKAVKWDDEG